MGGVNVQLGVLDQLLQVMLDVLLVFFICYDKVKVVYFVFMYNFGYDLQFILVIGVDFFVSYMECLMCEIMFVIVEYGLVNVLVDMLCVEVGNSIVDFMLIEIKFFYECC